MFLLRFLFTKSETEIYDKVKARNKQDLRNWNLANVVFPITTFLITILILSYTPKSQHIENYFPVLLGGALPLTAINILIAASFFLIKYDKRKESKHGIETSRTRLKLIFYAFVAYLFATELFVIQTIYTPFGTYLERISQVAYSIVAIYISLMISNMLFLLQEEMIDNSYEGVITDNVNKLKAAIK